MLKKIINIFYLTSFLIFIILTVRFYLSDQNIRETNKSRAFYSVKIDNKTQNLPLLKNDTNNIIEYVNDVEVYKKNNKIYSTGGRVLNITSSSESLIEARNKSLNNLDIIKWSDGFFRKDIGWRVIKK